MPLLAVMVLVMLVFMGMTLDLGRWLLAREAVITATEAASRAGAATGERWTQFTAKWNYYDWELDTDTVCDANGNCRTEREWVCRFQEVRSRVFRGLERDLTDLDQWKSMVDTGCRPGAKWIEGTRERWVEFRDPTPTAVTLFYSNIEGARRLDAKVEMPRVTVYDNPAEPEYPSVRVEAKAWVPSRFLPLLGIHGFPVERCGQTIVKGYRSGVQDACGKRSGPW